MKIIAIAGGIGSGKSVVSQILRKLGYSVYDCDSEAKSLMNRSCEIKRDLQTAFGDIVGADGNINSKKLAGIVFADKSALNRLNGIVHPRVKTDILEWCRSKNADKVFVETAILEESGLGDIVDEVWQVYAPIDVRIARVMKRNNMTEEEVRSRIESQKAPSDAVDGAIVNDGVMAVLPQIMARLG